MADTTFKPRKAHGITHLYNEHLIAFQHTTSSVSLPPGARQNILFFIGGLTDNICTPPHTSAIAAHLSLCWGLVEVQLTSSGRGFGTSSLRQDAKEIGECVDYFRSLGVDKVALMGHSTGCQDVMQYLVGSANKSNPGAAEADEEARSRPSVQGAILQAPVSDREGMEVTGYDPDTLWHAVELAEELVKAGKEENVLPFELTRDVLDTTPTSAYRFLSLSQKGGDDDFFSSDLDDEMFEQTFGKIPMATKLCVLYSGKDEYCQENIDKEGLMRRWRVQVEKGTAGEEGWSGKSGVVQGASHSLKGDPEEVVDDMVNRVVGFLESL